MRCLLSFCLLLAISAVVVLTSVRQESKKPDIHQFMNCDDSKLSTYCQLCGLAKGYCRFKESTDTGKCHFFCSFDEQKSKGGTKNKKKANLWGYYKMEIKCKDGEYFENTTENYVNKTHKSKKEKAQEKVEVNLKSEQRFMNERKAEQGKGKLRNQGSDKKGGNYYTKFKDNGRNKIQNKTVTCRADEVNKIMGTIFRKGTKINTKEAIEEQDKPLMKILRNGVTAKLKQNETNSKNGSVKNGITEKKEQESNHNISNNLKATNVTGKYCSKDPEKIKAKQKYYGINEDNLQDKALPKADDSGCEEVRKERGQGQSTNNEGLKEEKNITRKVKQVTDLQVIKSEIVVVRENWVKKNEEKPKRKHPSSSEGK